MIDLPQTFWEAAWVAVTDPFNWGMAGLLVLVYVAAFIAVEEPRKKK